jgi:dipeptidyl aminopeptidase/acylaminoacyl peptidase
MHPVVRATLLGCGALALSACSTDTPDPAATPGAGQSELIPVEVLFDDPATHSITISPDGRWLAYLKAYQGKLNVHVRGVDDSSAVTERAITRDSVRPIPAFWWSADGRRILFLQDRGGDESYHLYAVDVADTLARARDLTPFARVEVDVVALSPHTPDVALITLNRRDPRLADAYRVHLGTGALELAAVNPGTFIGYLADRANQVRIAYAVDSLGQYGLFERTTERSTWRLVRRYPAQDKITPLRLTPDGQTLYMLSNHEVDLSRLVLVDLVDGRERVVDADPLQEVDIGAAIFDAATDELLVTRYVGDTTRLYPHADDVRQLLTHVRRAGPGDVELGSSTRDRARWVVNRSAPTMPGTIDLFHVNTGERQELSRIRPSLDRYTLAAMRPITFRARDGLSMHGYLSTPPGLKARQLPLVVLVHGGPWERDQWGFQGDVQLLANRGYAVLQVNFRGSTGYGKEFARAARKQFARAMHTDLLDGVQWAVRSGVADSTRVAIMGGSYGGYAALVGLTFTPDAFRCAVDYAGSSSLVTLLESFPPSWAPYLPRSWYPFVGDPRNASDRADLLSRSPLLRADSARAPLLIFQGANDPRVTQRESDQIARALHARGIPVTYLLARDEGHSFGQVVTAMAVNRETERFLGRCLGGRVQERVPDRINAALNAMRVDLDSLGRASSR